MTGQNGCMQRLPHGEVKVPWLRELQMHPALPKRSCHAPTLLRCMGQICRGQPGRVLLHQIDIGVRWQACTIQQSKIGALHSECICPQGSADRASQHWLGHISIGETFTERVQLAVKLCSFASVSRVSRDGNQPSHRHMTVSKSDCLHQGQNAAK